MTINIVGPTRSYVKLIKICWQITTPGFLGVF